MGLVELFVSVLIAGVSAVNAGVPLGAWWRTREARFLWVVAAGASLFILGASAAWAELPGSTTSTMVVPLLPLLLVLACALFLLAATVWPRRS